MTLIFTFIQLCSLQQSNSRKNKVILVKVKSLTHYSVVSVIVMSYQTLQAFLEVLTN